MPATTTKEERRLPRVGEEVVTSSQRSFRVEELLGEGGYGSVFRVTEDGTCREYALKAETMTKTMLRTEVSVLKAAREANCEHICELIDYGRVDSEFMFIVMTLLGPDLYKLKREQPNLRFSAGTGIRVAIQSLQAIEELHSCGFISRDIKPSNFAVGNFMDGLQRHIFLFDFGLAKKYVDKNQNVLPSRGNVGWRGTCRYAPLSAHDKMDLARKDDIESWFYMIVELTSGNLPWRHITDRDVVKQAKEEVRGASRSRFQSRCPVNFYGILEAVDRLSFESRPPYDQFHEALNKIRKSNEVRTSDRFDWETDLTLSTQIPLSSGRRSGGLTSASTDKASSVTCFSSRLPSGRSRPDLSLLHKRTTEAQPSLSKAPNAAPRKGRRPKQKKILKLLKKNGKPLKKPTVCRTSGGSKQNFVAKPPRMLASQPIQVSGQSSTATQTSSPKSVLRPAAQTNLSLSRLKLPSSFGSVPPSPVQRRRSRKQTPHLFRS